MSQPGKVSNYILLTVVIICTIAAGFVFYDVLFSKPLIMSGIIVDKLYVPAKNTASPNTLNYRRYKTYDYNVVAQEDHQWIAFVKLNDGQILKVNCHTDHYEKKQVGDTLHFKEYTGSILHIDYFSHNEEDEEIENKN